MHKANLLNYIRHPEKLDRNTLDNILEVKKLYPYFQTVRLLAVKSRFLLGDEGYPAEIESAAAYVADRRVLYDLLYPLSDIPVTEDDTDISNASADTDAADLTLESEMEFASAESAEMASDEVDTSDQVPVVETPASAPPTLRDNISNLLSMQLHELELVDPSEVELVPEIALDIEKTYGGQDTDSPVEDFLTEGDLLMIDNETETIEENTLPDQPSGSGPAHTFTEWLSEVKIPTEIKENTADMAESPSDDTDGREEEISSGRIDKRKLIEQFIESNPRLQPRQDNNPPVDISEESVREHDGIFTDTLAKIYIKQGYYSKAIFAYEKLILKYPEKSDYFAGQISAIKLLKNNQ